MNIHSQNNIFFLAHFLLFAFILQILYTNILFSILMIVLLLSLYQGNNIKSQKLMLDGNQ